MACGRGSAGVALELRPAAVAAVDVVEPVVVALEELGEADAVGLGS